MRTVEQKRSEYALSMVLEIPDKKKGKFKNFAAGAPSMILQNGFGQALAFWLSKADENNKQSTLVNMVIQWLSYKNKDVNNNFVSQTNRKEFMLEISKMNQVKYLNAQNETLKLLQWVKRFANANF